MYLGAFYLLWIGIVHSTYIYIESTSLFIPLCALFGALLSNSPILNVHAHEFTSLRRSFIQFNFDTIDAKRSEPFSDLSFFSISLQLLGCTGNERKIRYFPHEWNVLVHIYIVNNGEWIENHK